MLWACVWDAWGSLGDLKGPFGTLGVLWVSLGRSLGVLGGPGSVLGSSWGALAVCWTSGAILGSVLGGQNVVISLVLGGILRCQVF